MLVGSGWQGIELTPLDFQIPLGRTIEDALAFILEMGPLSAPLGEVTGENRTELSTPLTGYWKTMPATMASSA